MGLCTGCHCAPRQSDRATGRPRPPSEHAGRARTSCYCSIEARLGSEGVLLLGRLDRPTRMPRRAGAVTVGAWGKARPCAAGRDGSCARRAWTARSPAPTHRVGWPMDAQPHSPESEQLHQPCSRHTALLQGAWPGDPSDSDVAPGPPDSHSYVTTRDPFFSRIFRVRALAVAAKSVQLVRFGRTVAEPVFTRRQQPRPESTLWRAQGADRPGADHAIIW